ncbi:MULTISPECIES: STAS/SEC14 domain-containing protein [unclassified Mesorhizobium]|uniref:STAS/SEC14 domain-containing protein n=1 Tax=unclassified Mesorhizobium TaxID=325217 RepID=UPI000FDB67C0|nr:MULTISPECIES: STAS/SEC14 domain-containing protein [unclassified Mesorhizobium]TGQ42722.1 STAS/SEC14 domain-containing protein [Mesorhizobium sp. M00.F.Ca.ET.216.01.1.1]TIS54003.1 MAG: STAS/SEC14 domain-containing protein [Mesorhizobium sp.]TIS86313.1 MAG: STAS/SEC14 domain-containing protein [Mesorhizobium sp.]TJW14563.1 MAG: STAS/SEC14 domain-containing protein [Mesorhizobium sp.]TJW44981.1 MAG: STAS/SEC14 domain-containing protein [Mesorhizobium sp.]
MNSLESVPAVRRIPTDRDDLFAVDIVGHVLASDAENLFGLLEAAYALHPRIDVLVRLIDHDGVDWAKVSGETVTQGTAHALEHVGRCAAVGEPNWIPEVQGLFTASLPVELRHFRAEDEAAAWEWLGARPIVRP